MDGEEQYRAARARLIDTLLRANVYLSTFHMTDRSGIAEELRGQRRRLLDLRDSGRLHIDRPMRYSREWLAVQARRIRPPWRSS